MRPKTYKRAGKIKLSKIQVILQKREKFVLYAALNELNCHRSLFGSDLSLPSSDDFSCFSFG
jgi:hypothetical protein